MGLLDSIVGTNTSAGTQAGAARNEQPYNDADFFGNQALDANTAAAVDALTSDANSALSPVLSRYGAATRLM